MQLKNFLLGIFILVLNISISQVKSNVIPGELLIQTATVQKSEANLRNFFLTENIAIEKFTCISEDLKIFHLVLSDKTTNLDELKRKLYLLNDVNVIQKNHVVNMRETIPNDTIFNDLWHLKNTGAGGGTPDADIDATDAWDITTGGLTTHGDTIVVCIIESNGVDMLHPDLVDNHWKNYSEIPDDGIDNDNNGYVDDYLGWNVSADDDNIGTGSHGTRVAGMVGAKGNNTTGITGVNWDVKMMIIRGQNASSEASVIEAYSYPLKMRKMYNESNGDEGAFVVCTNASWGIDGGDPEDSPLWCAIYDSLGAEGILNIAATTNNNNNVDVVGDLPTTCTSEYLVAVTMTNKDDIRASAGYGSEHVDLGAPGSGVKLTTTGGFYTTTSGTSFASPCVAGAVALAYSSPCADFINLVKYDPAAAALEMREYLLNSVDLVPGLSGEVASNGRLNVNSYITDLVGDCDPNSCIPPYNIEGVTVTDSAIFLNWEGFADDFIVTIESSTGGSMNFDVIGSMELLIEDLTPCTNYTVTIKADCGSGELSNDSYPYVFRTDGCCVNPHLTADDITDNSFTINWNPVLYATGYDLNYRQAGETSWILMEDVSSPILFDDIGNCNTLEYQIKTICADSTQGFGPIQSFTTLGCGVCVEKDYCTVNSAVTSLEWLERIKIDTYENISGENGGYLKYPGIVVALEQGNTYSVEFEPGYTGTNFTERFTVWIDFNLNGEFEASEQVITDETTTSVLNSTITIPASAITGLTQMRIGMSAIISPIACPEDAFYGEYEDYCIYIGGYTGTENQTEQEFVVYPNPSSEFLYLKFSDSASRIINVFDITGKLVYSFTGNNSLETLNINEFESGIYQIVVTDENGMIATQKFIKQ